MGHGCSTQCAQFAKTITSYDNAYSVFVYSFSYEPVLTQCFTLCFFYTKREGMDEIMSEGNEGKQKQEPLWKHIGNLILNALAGCLTPLIPMLITAAMLKTLAAVLGPDMFGLISAESDLYVLLTFAGDAGFYFFPIILGYCASKQFGVTPVLGMLLGGILLHPTMVELAAANTPFTVYGIPCAVQNYSGTIIPIILSVWIMGYVERFFHKLIPASLDIVFTPLLTILVMLPLALCLLGPAGNFVGNYMTDAIMALGNAGGLVTIITVTLLGTLWQFVVMCGLHWLLIATVTVVLSTSGSESVMVPIIAAASFAVGGMCLGAFLKLKQKEDRSLAMSYVVAQVIGGVTEPGLYGIGFRYKKPLFGMMLGGFAGSLYAAISGLTAYSIVPVASFLCIFSYTGGSVMNVVNGVLSGVIGFVVAAVATYIIGLGSPTEESVNPSTAKD